MALDKKVTKLQKLAPQRAEPVATLVTRNQQSSVEVQALEGWGIAGWCCGPQDGGTWQQLGVLSMKFVSR